MSWFAIGACDHASVSHPDFAQVPAFVALGTGERLGQGGNIPATNGNDNETCSITEYISSFEQGRFEAS